MSRNQAIQPTHELDNARVIVDPRSFWPRFWDGLQNPVIPLVWGVISVPLILLWPFLIVPLMFVQLILWMAVVMKPDVLPIHLPIDAYKTDKNDPLPGDNTGFYKARGSFFIGRILGSGVEIWVSFKALTQHFLIFGTTGSGKTESIVSYIVNYLSVGSGAAFQDSKAAPKAMIQMATFCRMFGRDDDFRVTNYITGNSAEKRDPAERLSNDAAIFARGSAESNTQLLVALLPPSEGDNKVFQERAIALVSAVMPALKDLQLQSKVQIDPATIRKYMGFKQFCDLYRNNFITMRSRNAMLAYLESLPGFDENKEVAKQPEEVSRQFGFAQAYFTRSLASLSDTYGHIYLTALGEIDYQDAVLNGRMLLTLLPSMEKSGEELSNLGKIVLTATRNGMVVGLGTAFEGSAEDIVHNLPTNSEIPYGIMNDENAYMLIEGQELINAQARGLGFGVITGTQDAPGMLENISKVTKQIMANSAFKQIMYLDDKETTELACEFSGEATVITRNRFNYKGDFGNIHGDDGLAVERRKRLDASSVKRLGLGQAYIMYQGKIHPTQVFNHGIKEKDKDPTMCYLTHWYSVRMPKVRLPDEKMITELRSHANIQEWDEIALMISDDSRSMLREMKTYFKSMLHINRIAASYTRHQGLLEIMANDEGDNSTYIAGNDRLVGILAKVVNKPLRHYKDAVDIVTALAGDRDSESMRIMDEAEEAGLFPLGDDDSIFDLAGDADDNESGGSGSGGLSSKPHENTASDPDDLLSAYMGGSDLDTPSPTTTAENAASDHSAASGPHSAVVEQPASPVAGSALAKAVEKNLANMPWMASAVEYEAVRESMIETETLFTETHAEAVEMADNALDILGQSLIYPETQIKQTSLDPDAVRKMLAHMMPPKRTQ